MSCKKCGYDYGHSGGCEDFGKPALSGKSQSAGSVWVEFDQELWANQKLPPQKRAVLLMLPKREDEGMPPCVAVGYLKFGAGDKNSPYFVIPGVGGVPTHWNDCFGDQFSPPLWVWEQTPND